MVFQQLLFADEVRALSDLHIEQVTVSGIELTLVLLNIGQLSEDGSNPLAPCFTLVRFSILSRVHLLFL
ncbi:hypothetical protein [Paraburkholderia sp. MM5477-R1]|uniref:hypothetical protein n=1 Tax=Paraburkholderia sp. MM5477-R1 TaxID=2991062 RepID=UPI003D1C56C3